jgi:hypothetical protein
VNGRKAFQELSLRDLYFVPVYIGYDQVIEQAVFRGAQLDGFAVLDIEDAGRVENLEVGQRVFVDPDSVVARGGDPMQRVAGPHNGVPYYYSLTKFAP